MGIRIFLYLKKKYSFFAFYFQCLLVGGGLTDGSLYSKCICLNCKMYMFKWQNVFVQVENILTYLQKNVFFIETLYFGEYLKTMPFETDLQIQKRHVFFHPNLFTFIKHFLILKALPVF